jgi:hypothetical protein
MSRFRFELATREDDADLRRIMAATPMPGNFSLSFQREPSWFAGAVVDGHTRQVVICRDSATGKVVGFGCRSLRDVFLNGEPATIGYLSTLRLLRDYRSLGLVARGYAFFRELHQDGRAPFYLTTIAAGNETALRVLTSGRAGLPSYYPAGDYLTLALTPVRQSRSAQIPPGIRIRHAESEDLPAVLEFLSRLGPGRQYFPRYSVEDFGQETGQLRSLAPGHILLAERGNAIAGVLAGWDQHVFRQTIVHSYPAWLSWLRPFHNFWAHCQGRLILPSPGSPLRYWTAALPVVENDDPAVFAGLVAALRRNLRGTVCSHLLLGLHEQDPLVSIARRRAFTCYRTHLFLVSWDSSKAVRAAVDARPPYLELGTL